MTTAEARAQDCGTVSADETAENILLRDPLIYFRGRTGFEEHLRREQLGCLA